MLTTILPGLRDLRTPLATGYMYLVLLWLLLGSRIPPKDEATGIISRVYEIEGTLGTTALIAVLSFVAYLLGTILSFRRIPKLRRELGRTDITSFKYVTRQTSDLRMSPTD